MKLEEVLFIDNLPKLDLHGYDRETARVSVNDFINDNIKTKHEIIVIIHGIGTGIIRKTVNDTLKKSKSVIEYKSFYNNRGATLVKISCK